MKDLSQYESYLQALVASVTLNTIIPLMILILLCGFIWRVLALAQRNRGFDITQVFRNDAGKISGLSFIMLLAFAMSCWYLAVDRLSASPNPLVFLFFLFAWAGSPALLELAKKWNGQLPFAQGAKVEVDTSK